MQANRATRFWKDFFFRLWLSRLPNLFFLIQQFIIKALPSHRWTTTGEKLSSHSWRLLQRGKKSNKKFYHGRRELQWPCCIFFLCVFIQLKSIDVFSWSLTDQDEARCFWFRYSIILTFRKYKMDKRLMSRTNMFRHDQTKKTEILLPAGLCPK